MDYDHTQTLELWAILGFNKRRKSDKTKLGFLSYAYYY